MGVVDVGNTPGRGQLSAELESVEVVRVDSVVRSRPQRLESCVPPPASLDQVPVFRQEEPPGDACRSGHRLVGSLVGSLAGAQATGPAHRSDRHARRRVDMIGDVAAENVHFMPGSRQGGGLAQHPRVARYG
jgi:hypothetical protein